MALAPTLRLRGPLIIAMTAAWLALGGIGVYRYVDGYALYRGFPKPVTPPGVPQGRVEHVYYRSRVLGKRFDYLVYLPPGYRRHPRRRYPVLYLLHGVPGNVHTFVRAGRLAVAEDVLLHQRAIRPFIVVMPGGPGWVDTEWANRRRGRYVSVIPEVVRQVDTRFRTRRSRTERVLGGLSEGAYAAINVGLHHVRLFGGLQAWSGYFVQLPDNGAFEHASPEALAANSPAEYVGSLAPWIRRLGLRAYLYGGNRRLHADAAQASFALRLRSAGAQVTSAVYPGAHDWALWRAQLPHMLKVASAWFASPPPGGRA
jgi:enterochelin esterase-like enzyme